MSYMPDPKAKPASTDPKRGKYVAKPAPKPVYAGVHVGKPKPPVSEAINSPFTRDAYPALTDAILGVVNGQPRPVEEDVQTPERAAEMAARKKKAAQHSAAAMKKNPEGAGTAAIVNSEIDLHIKDKRERDSKKTYGKGGKLVKRAVKESQELDERIIDEVDAFQAAKNWVKGKGFKTNREVSYAKVQKNYDAMKKRQEAEAKKNK